MQTLAKAPIISPVLLQSPQVVDGTFCDDHMDKPDEDKDRSRVRAVCERVLGAIEEEQIAHGIFLQRRLSAVASDRRSHGDKPQMVHV